MDLDGSLSTEVAIIKNEQDYNDIVTMGQEGGVTDRTGDKPDQSGVTRMGELLRGWALQ